MVVDGTELSSDVGLFLMIVNQYSTPSGCMAGVLQVQGKLFVPNQLLVVMRCNEKEGGIPNIIKRKLTALTISLTTTAHARVHGRYHGHCTMATLPKEVLRLESAGALDRSI